ncbi:nuclear transport factor 2 family protein [Compostimonas suwonensis]|uniref:SnoaL-like protein n=1 Tax=Compostimonas suwonensis TaxID=1048394 RepID=A0A2M9BCQ3_9MICO|nr:nuclear transport factor 2 family protein [Compostimonas suwonensis]PJJ55720.1 SnoaL-like protein [Compostimonas suwonensis]
MSEIADPVAEWIAGYRRAWQSNDPADIRALFTEDADYRTDPWVEPWHGHAQIVSGWLERRDEPGTTTFEWTPLAVTDAVAVVQGVTVYSNAPNYSNLWVIRLAEDGRAREFTEWWMNQSVPSASLLPS